MQDGMRRSLTDPYVLVLIHSLSLKSPLEKLTYVMYLQAPVR